jgi:arabinogalactan oligomer / maltooligosaccharide transport system permease protein
MVNNLFNNSLIMGASRFAMFIDSLGYILLGLLMLTIFFVSISIALDIFDAKLVSKKRFSHIYLPSFGVAAVFLLILALRKSIGLSSSFLQNLSIILLIILVVYNIFIAISIENLSHKKSSMIYRVNLKLNEIVMRVLLYGEIIFMVAIVLVPVIYIVGSSVSPTYGITTKIFPKNPSLRNFKVLFDDTNYLAWYWSTFKIAIFTMIFSVILSTGTAYIFSRFKFVGKKWGLIALLVLQMFPSFMGLLALFTLYKQFGLIDNPNALVLIYVAGQIPYNTWLIKGYLSGIPKSLDESARMDGANGLQIFLKIIFPLAVPILTFVAVTTFMSPWMDYMLASFLLINDENYTLAVGLFNFINSKEAQNYSMFAAGALLIALPIGTLYVSLQRFLIEGITAGANKG